MDVAPAPSGTLGAVIRQRYKAIGYTDESFADAANIAYRTFRRRINGSPITSDELGRIARVLNTTVSDLWREVEASLESGAA